MDEQESLIAVVSHDLRNPLASIKMSTEALLKHGLSPQDHALVFRISRGTDRLIRMVNDLLDFTRVQNKLGIMITPKMDEMGKLVIEVFHEFQLLYTNVEFRLQVKGVMDGCWDSDRLKQVLGNLLSNAVQHGTPGEAVTVTLTATKIEDRDSVTISVCNLGKQLDPVLAKRLFDPFVQGGDSSRVHLGLGLYIVEQIVLAHGGSVSVRAVPDGTCIEVTIPRWNELPSALTS